MICDVCPQMWANGGRRISPGGTFCGSATVSGEALLELAIGEHNARGFNATRWQNKKSELQDNVTSGFA